MDKRRDKKGLRSSRSPSLNHPTISLVMIVKNEERFIQGALKSAKDWANELIVLDTGSEDRTVELARALGAKVYHFNWSDDFAAARNASLSYATSDWVAILDADERFVIDHTDRITEIFIKTDTWPYQALMYEACCYT